MYGEVVDSRTASERRGNNIKLCIREKKSCKRKGGRREYDDLSN